MPNPETNAAFSQLVLQYYDISLISPKALGELTGRTPEGSGKSLRLLGWDQIRSATEKGGSLWERNGHQNCLEMRYAKKMFQRWLRRNEQT